MPSVPRLARFFGGLHHQQYQSASLKESEDSRCKRKYGADASGAGGAAGAFFAPIPLQGVFWTRFERPKRRSCAGKKHFEQPKTCSSPGKMYFERPKTCSSPGKKRFERVKSRPEDESVAFWLLESTPFAPDSGFRLGKSRGHGVESGSRSVERRGFGATGRTRFDETNQVRRKTTFTASLRGSAGPPGSFYVSTLLARLFPQDPIGF